MMKKRQLELDLPSPSPPVTVTQVDGIELSDEQRRIIDAFTTDPYRRSALLTGAAGTGKSFLLRALLSVLPSTGLFVTATTGIAAAAIGGTTIHSWGGLGFGNKPVEVIVEEILKYNATKERIRSAQLLVIDEISMMSPMLFDTLDGVMRAIRNRPNVPFGGCRLLLVGDFCQLPPVIKLSEQEQQPTTPWIFDSDAWTALDPVIYYLTVSHRHSDDPAFLTLLNDVRIGVLTSESQRLLAEAGERRHPSDRNTVHIYPVNRQVDAYNTERLAGLPGESKTFKARDYVSPKHNASSKLDACPYPATIDLKVGAQVMLRKNICVSMGLFNGAVGTVLEFDETTGMPWVSFEASNGPSRFLVERLDWDVKIGRGLNQLKIASRSQLPLILAWAISAHKSQGMTITVPVVADLQHLFASGQLYVILSRVRRLQQLSLLNVDAITIPRVDERVLAFYNRLTPTWIAK